MKATRYEPPKPFTPVVLTLESQAEVDALWGIANHTTVNMDVKALLPAIDQYQVDGYTYFDSLVARLNARGFK